jgi:hypothetical protein
MASVPRRWAAGEDFYFARTSKQVRLIRSSTRRATLPREGIGQAIRFLNIKREEHPDPALLEVHLPQLPNPWSANFGAFQTGLSWPPGGPQDR